MGGGDVQVGKFVNNQLHKWANSYTTELISGKKQGRGETKQEHEGNKKDATSYIHVMIFQLCASLVVVYLWFFCFTIFIRHTAEHLISFHLLLLVSFFFQADNLETCFHCPFMTDMFMGRVYSLNMNKKRNRWWNYCSSYFLKQLQCSPL